MPTVWEVLCLQERPDGSYTEQALVRAPAL